MGEVDGRVVIITGGGNGIGKATARLFGAAGAKVVVADVQQVAAQAVADQIVAEGGFAIAIHHDVRDLASSEALAARSIGEFGTIDVLVNNAGVGPKWAVIGFTQCIARELAPTGITVNAVCPGVIRTPVARRGGLRLVPAAS